MDGVFYEGDGLVAGQCGLRIQNFRAENIGRWSCTLVSEKGGTSTGFVTPGELRLFHCFAIVCHVNVSICSVIGTATPKAHRLCPRARRKSTTECFCILLVRI